MSLISRKCRICEIFNRTIFQKKRILHFIFRIWKTTEIVEQFKCFSSDYSKKNIKWNNEETYVDNSRICTATELQQKALQNKVEFAFFKKVIFQIVNKNIETYSIELLILILVIIHKNYPFYKEHFDSQIYKKLNKDLFSLIKLRMHYLYTCKMVIYTMHMLIALHSLDHAIVDFYIQKCYYFLKTEEYQLSDLIHFLSIFGKIHLWKKNTEVANFKRLNYSLIKILCDKITYHFDRCFTTSMDYNYIHNLKKEIDHQITHLSDQHYKNEEKTKSYKKNTKQTCTKKKKDENIVDIPKQTDDIHIFLDTHEKTLLDVGVTICQSLKELEYVHMSLINELINALKKTFLKIEKHAIHIDNVSMNKIFLILQYLLLMQIQHHMFYKYILNTFKARLPYLPNLELLFFLLGKNKLFPNRTIDIFDMSFIQNIQKGTYDNNSNSNNNSNNNNQSLLLLESYSEHFYRNVQVISLLLRHLLWRWDTNTTLTHTDQETIGQNKTNTTVIEMIKVLYALFKLDIYEEQLTSRLHSKVLNEQVINSLNYKLLINLLLSFCYFSIEDLNIYNRILKKLITLDILLDNVYLTKLKICELALRTQHVPNIINQLSDECKEYLSHIKNKEQPAELHIKSNLQKNVKNILLTFNLSVTEEVPIGPYTVDFAEPEREENKRFLFSKKKKEKTYLNKEEKEKEKETENVIRTEEQKRIIMEVDGENHFYKNTKNYISFSKLKHKLLTDLGYIVVNIPYFHWAQLPTDLDKKAYLKKIIYDCTNMQITSTIPLNQKNVFLKHSEIESVQNAIHNCQDRAQWIRCIKQLRNKKKLQFLRRKKRSVLANK